jgi:hypothetical protein
VERVLLGHGAGVVIGHDRREANERERQVTRRQEALLGLPFGPLVEVDEGRLSVVWRLGDPTGPTAGAVQRREDEQPLQPWAALGERREPLGALNVDLVSGRALDVERRQGGRVDDACHGGRVHGGEGLGIPQVGGHHLHPWGGCRVTEGRLFPDELRAVGGAHGQQ